MRLKRWQAVLFVTSILWGLVGTALTITSFPKTTSTVQTIIKQSSGTHGTGQILDAKYDTALRNRLGAGVGENEMLDVILLLDQENPQSASAREAVESIGGVVQYEYHLFQGILATLPAAALKTLAGSIAITGICDDYTVSIPKDASPTTALANTNNWWRGAVGAEGVAQDGSGVTIAIIDTGLGYLTSSGTEAYHSDLENQIVGYKNFAWEDDRMESENILDWNGHGTHTAGIALGTGEALSSKKYEGIAPGADLLVVKVINASGDGDRSNILKGLEWAVDNGANITSISLGWGNYPEVFTPEGAAIKSATEKDVLVVVSAGNSGPDYFTGSVPGSNLYTLSVAASDQNNKIADFSSTGPTFAMQAYPSITAPGVDIIAPLGSNSHIEMQEEYLENVISGTSGSDYVPLSGTSMSAPMVAGAAALLLDEYPETNATTLRIALMESATDLGYPEVQQGSGLLNVSAALDYLENLQNMEHSTTINNVTTVYPKEVPFAPYDLLQFPGDAQTMNLTVISGIARNVSVELPKIEGITFSSSSPKLAVNFTNAGVQLWNLTIQVDWNASAGEKSGWINFTDGKTGQILDQVVFNITVTLPKKRVYFDSFHGLNDYIDAVVYATSQYELYNFAKAFTAKNYSVDLRMEYWTPGYDPAEGGRLLTYDLLQNYDAVVLQTPSLPYTATELQALVDFRNRNGSILIIGDRHQSLAVDSVNDLLARLGTGISILTENLESLQFYGEYGLRSSYLITPTTGSDDLTKGVQNLIFDWGALLNTSGSAKAALKASSYGSTIAAKANGTSSAGNVAVISGPSLVSNTYMTDPAYGGNHTRFASNLIDYLLPEQKFNIARKVTPERSIDGITKTYLYVTNGSTGTPVTGLVGGDNITLTSSNPAVSGAVDFVNVTEQAPGIYVNTSFIIGTANTSPYFLNASVKMASLVRNSTAAAIRAGSIVVLSSFNQAENAIARGIALGYPYETTQTLSLHSSNILDTNSRKVYCGSTPLSAFNTKKQYSFNLSLNVLSGMDYDVTFDAQEGKTAGLYAYFFEGSTVDGYSNIYSNRNQYEVVNFKPSILESLSQIGHSSFADLTTDDGYYIIQEVTQLESYSFSVYASESYDFEDKMNQLTGVVVFMPAYIFNNTVGLLIGSGDLPIAGLTYASTSFRLVGEITIPETVTMPKGDGTNLEKDTAASGDYIAIFEVAVMDSEGGHADYIIILNVASYFDPLLLILILVAIIGGIAAVAIVLYRRYRKKTEMSRSQYQSAYETRGEAPASSGYGYVPEQQFGTESQPPTQLRKFCPYCGHPIPLEATQCPNCGANIPSMNPF